MISDVKPGEQVLYLRHNEKRFRRAMVVRLTRWRGQPYAWVNDGARTFRIDREDIVRVVTR